jgi:hypothetical protein
MSGSAGGGEETTGRKADTAPRRRPNLSPATPGTTPAELRSVRAEQGRDERKVANPIVRSGVLRTAEAIVPRARPDGSSLPRSPARTSRPGQPLLNGVVVVGQGIIDLGPAGVV